MMAVLDPLDDGGELAAKFVVQTGAKDLADLIGGEPPQSQLTTAFEDFVDWEVALENEIAAVLDLRKSIKARQIDLLAFAFGELRTQNQGPVVQPLADDFRAEPVGGSLQLHGIIDSQKGVVVFAEADLFAV